MAEELKFEIGNKAEKLYFDVFDITTNRKSYPVKHRRIADKLQETVLNIYCHLLDANSIKADTAQRKEKRFDVQTAAITECNKFLSLAKYSLHAGLISAATCERWADFAHDVKFMTLAWRRS